MCHPTGYFRDCWGGPGAVVSGDPAHQEHEERLAEYLLRARVGHPRGAGSQWDRLRRAALEVWESDDWLLGNDAQCMERLYNRRHHLR